MHSASAFQLQQPQSPHDRKASQSTSLPRVALLPSVKTREHNSSPRTRHTIQNPDPDMAPLPSPCPRSILISYFHRLPTKKRKVTDFFGLIPRAYTRPLYRLLLNLTNSSRRRVRSPGTVFFTLPVASAASTEWSLGIPGPPRHPGARLLPDLAAGRLSRCPDAHVIRAFPQETCWLGGHLEGARADGHSRFSLIFLLSDAVSSGLLIHR